MSSYLLEVAYKLEHCGLIVERLADSEIVFEIAHPLYPPLVRAQLQTNELNRLYGCAIEVSKTVSKRARYARACGHHRATEWTLEALEEAQRRFAHEEVRRHAQWLLETDTGCDRSEYWRFTLGRALLALGNPAQAAVTLEGSLDPEGVLYPSLGILLRPEWSALLMSASTVIVTLNALSLNRVRFNAGSSPTPNSAHT